MRRRKKIPECFLIAEHTRLEPLLEALQSLPPGTGVIFRCYGEKNRALWAARLAALARRRRLAFLIAGDDFSLFRRLRADGVHLPEWAAARRFPGHPRLPRQRPFLLTIAAHTHRALARAKTLGASAAILSPLHATASHPGAPALGVHRFSRLARGTRLPVIALGGLTAERARAAKDFGAAGAAGISMFMRHGRIRTAENQAIRSSCWCRDRRRWHRD